jgi:membrane dipeptidase
VNGVGSFIGPGDGELAERLVEHVCHIADLVGPQHVGLGLDYMFDLAEVLDDKHRDKHYLPDGLVSDDEKLVAPEDLPRLVEGLIARGWPETDIAAFLGGNLRRVAQDSWKPVARS